MSDALDRLFASGLAVDVALAVIALEFAFLLSRRPAGERRAAVVELVLALGPGACLMLALRAALTGAGAGWVAAWLVASLPLHLMDVRRRGL